MRAPSFHPSPKALALIAAGLLFVAAFVVAFAGSILVALGLGVLGLAAVLWIGWRRASAETDLSRRSFLRGAGLAGLGVVAGGAGLGRVAERLARPDAKPVLDGMARGVGSEGMRLVKRGYFPGRSGDLQLVLTPFNTSNYSFESLDLRHDDPRSSHAMTWGYTERVPILAYAPGVIAAGDSTERVTLADLAPAAAEMMGFRQFQQRDGSPLPGLPALKQAPKVIVTFVIDGGGWNVLKHWEKEDAWPNLKRLMSKGMVYRNAIMGSFPSVTACAHATIGTGAFPSGHGISGHSVRSNGLVVKAYGDPGAADPSFILIPTLADQWNDFTGNKAWVGEIGYQIWHLGMLGHGGRPLGRQPVAIYYDEDMHKRWASQNPDLYRLPEGLPPQQQLTTYLNQYFPPDKAKEIEHGAGHLVCCSPPIIRYQGDIVAEAFDQEPIGQTEATSLLYINYKSPDYTGHVYNMLRQEERIALEATDRELGRVAAILEKKFKPGEFVLFVTADHGQCPLIDVAGGVRLDPIQLADDISHPFGRSVWNLVQDVRPSEVYLDSRALWDGGVTADDVAAHLAGYRYRDNIGPYIKPYAIDQGRMDRPEFTGVFSTNYIGSLSEAAIRSFGSGRFDTAPSDPGIPPRTW